MNSLSQTNKKKLKEFVACFLEIQVRKLALQKERKAEHIRGNGASQVVLAIKKPPANAGDPRDMPSVPGSGRLPGGGNGGSLQYACLGNPVDRGAWYAAVPEVAKESDKT